LKQDEHTFASGLGYGVLAFLAWGFLPLYWKVLVDVPAVELLAHRVFWSLIFVGLLLLINSQIFSFFRVLKDAGNWKIFSITSLLIGGNWYLYIWAVNAGHVLETSLGYFINPLVSVLFGYLFFRERLSKGQLVALTFAAAGVLNLTINFGTFPWIAITLAITFGIYGLLRKMARADSLIGLSLETLVLSPVALAFLFWLEIKKLGSFGQSFGFDGTVDWVRFSFLIGSGVVTACPLLWFASAARRLQLSTVGFLQYLAPTCQFLLAVFVFKESFTLTHFFSFSLIWLALLLYSLESWRKRFRYMGLKK